MPWLRGLFMFEFPLSISLCLTDLLLLEGYDIIFAVMLSFFKEVEDRLLRFSFEEVLPTYRELVSNFKDVKGLLAGVRTFWPLVQKDLPTLLSETDCANLFAAASYPYLTT
jgi:hypothetical protein